MGRVESKQRLRRTVVSGALIAIFLVVVAIACVGIAVAVMSGLLGTVFVKTDMMAMSLRGWNVLCLNGYKGI